jgi:hypothetical protein
MHGLINRSIQHFLRDTYGAAAWDDVARAAQVPQDGFEALERYDDAVTDRVLAAASARIGRGRDALLEDLGTWLVFGRDTGWLRRLLRFSGVGFVDFLHSLDDLPDRARLAVPDLVLPPIEVTEHSVNRYTLATRTSWEGFGHVLVGALRAMADDYGALAMLEHDGRQDGVETLSIELLDQAFAAGRRFRLSGVGG